MNIRENIDLSKPDKIASLALLAQAAPQLVWAVLIATTLGIGLAIWWLWLWLNFIATIASILILVLTSWSIITGKIKEVRALQKDKVHLSKEIMQLEMLRVKVERERARADMERNILPRVVEGAVLTGMNFTYSAKGDMNVSHWMSNIHTLGNGTQKDLKLLEQPETVPLPNTVYYEDIVDRIPDGHTLIGVIGDNELVTRPPDVECCEWIVGSSGTGKTTTTSFRIERKIERRAKLLINDPHYFKPDSLYHAVQKYQEHFLHPVARTNEEMLASATMFLEEFDRRKKGVVSAPYELWVFVIDELNSINEPDEDDEVAEALLIAVKKIVRITGTESRNFGMESINISQRSTGLSWVRKDASTCYVHKINNWNERLLAVNDDRKLARSMDTWPKGRTVVHGTGFEEGPILCQQPVRREVANKQEATVNEDDFMEYWYSHFQEEGKYPSVRDIEKKFNCTNHRARVLRSKVVD
jgi:hypothetical protein